MTRVLVLVLLIAAGFSSTSCGASVSCENLCAHTQPCNVTFRPRDDEDGAKIRSGARTVDEDCVLGCQENPAVTVDSAHCVDDATAKSTDPNVCQEPVLQCLGQA